MSLFANVLTVGGATLVSRVLGFARDGLLAAAFGSGPVADAFFVAFRLPNLFRRLFAEGAFSAAFVPLLVAVRAEEGRDAGRRFAGEAAVLLFAAVLALTVPAMIFAPEIVALLAPGFADDPDKLALTAGLARLCFPYLACVSMVALVAGVLGAEKRFLAAAAAPILLNLVMIAALAGLLVFAVPPGVLAGRVAATAVTVAGLAQVALLAVAAVRAGVFPRPVRPRRSERLARLGRALLPGLLAGGLAEINLVVATMIASIEDGAVSWLWYADRLHQLPLGIVGIAVGQVLLPEIADVLAGERRAEVHAVQNRALEFALALAVPAAVALALLAEPIVSVLFRRGAFGDADVVETVRALVVLAAGLPAFVAVKVLSPGFWGRGDTRTPMLIGAAVVAVNLALALALRPLVGWVAVAAAATAGGWVNAGLLWTVLLRRDHWRIDAAFAHRLPRLLLAALAMGATVALAAGLATPALAVAAGTTLRVATLAGLVVLGLAVYAGLVAALRVVDLAALARARRRDHHVSPPTCPPPADRA